jgi:hypothetical protein
MKSATVRQMTPKMAPSLSFSSTELMLIHEALRIASDDIAVSASALEKVYPTSPLVERTRIYAEQMQDLRERIEANS